MMKRLSMGIASLMVNSPSPFLNGVISDNSAMIALLILISGWAGFEFYIGVLRPCAGQAASCLPIKIGRTLWPFLFSIPGFLGMLAAAVPSVVYRTSAEEQMLAREFGDRFLEDKCNAYRLIPFIY